MLNDSLLYSYISALTILTAILYIYTNSKMDNQFADSSNTDHPDDLGRYIEDSDTECELRLSNAVAGDNIDLAGCKRTVEQTNNFSNVNSNTNANTSSNTNSNTNANLFQSPEQQANKVVKFAEEKPYSVVSQDALAALHESMMGADAYTDIDLVGPGRLGAIGQSREAIPSDGLNPEFAIDGQLRRSNREYLDNKLLNALESNQSGITAAGSVGIAGQTGSDSSAVVENKTIVELQSKLEQSNVTETKLTESIKTILYSIRVEYLQYNDLHKKLRNADIPIDVTIDSDTSLPSSLFMNIESVSTLLKGGQDAARQKIDECKRKIEELNYQLKATINVLKLCTAEHNTLQSNILTEQIKHLASMPRTIVQAKPPRYNSGEEVMSEYHKHTLLLGSDAERMSVRRVL